jgi:chromosomal replication initiator protein
MAQTDETKKITTYKITPEKAWEAAIGQLKITMDKQTFSTLMGKSEFVKYENNTFFISVPNTFTRDWLEQRLTETVIRILSGIMEGQQFVQFVLDRMLMPFGKKKRFNRNPLVATVSASQFVCREGAINPRYTFDNLLSVRQQSVMRFAAVRAMPATAYNPLFIYSGAVWEKRICSMRSEMKSFGIK